MRINQPNNLFKKIIYSNFILLICFFLIIFFSINFLRDILNKNQLNAEVEKLKKQIEEQAAKNNQLNSLISYFGTSDYLEEEARLKLNKKLPGEEVIILPQGLLSQTATSTAKNLTTIDNRDIEKNNLLKWWKYIFPAKTP